VRLYEYLEHTADIKVRVRASSISELFSEAIKAIMDVVYDVEKAEPKEAIEYEAEGLDPGELLYDLGNYAIALLDEGFATARLEVKSISIELSGDSEKRIAHVVFYGEPYDKNKHGFKTLVKAFTYNDLRICLEGYERSAEFVLDI